MSRISAELQRTENQIKKLEVWMGSSDSSRSKNLKKSE